MAEIVTGAAAKHELDLKLDLARAHVGQRRLVGECLDHRIAITDG